MNLRAEEISSIIKNQIRDYHQKTECSETGSVILVGDGIAKAQGLEKCMANELLEFEGGGYGMALNLEENVVSIVLLDNIDLGDTSIVVPAGKAVTLDLNGKTISGVCNTDQGYLIRVENTADLIIKDTVGSGKITYASGSSKTGQ